MGFIAQEKLSSDNDLVTMTPGVNSASMGDNLGQNYNTPEYVITHKKTDIIIVGRGIYGSRNPKEAACHYKEQAWDLLSQ